MGTRTLRWRSRVWTHCKDVVNLVTYISILCKIVTKSPRFNHFSKMPPRSALFKDKYSNDQLISDLWTIVDSYLGFTVYVYERTHKYYTDVNGRQSWLHEVFIDIHFDFPATKDFKLETSVPVNVVIERKRIGKRENSYHTDTESVCVSEETVIVDLEPGLGYFKTFYDQNKSYSCYFSGYGPSILYVVTHAIVHSICWQNPTNNVRLIE